MRISYNADINNSIHLVNLPYLFVICSSQQQIIIYNKQYQMSIYSGFSTRQVQESYNNLLLKAISLMQNKLLQFINKEEKSINIFAIKFIRIIKKLKEYQQRKYLPPKFTQGFQELNFKLDSFVKDQPDQNISIDLTEKNHMIPPLRKESVRSKRQNPNFQKQSKSKQMVPSELPPKYQLIYNSQTNQKINKFDKPRFNEEESKQQRKRNITLNDSDTKISLIQRNTINYNPLRLYNNRNIQAYQRTSQQIQQNPMTYYSYNEQIKQQRELGPKGIIKYKQGSSRNKETNRTHLDIIKQRVRTQQIDKISHKSNKSKHFQQTLIEHDKQSLS